jgi:predicted dehydrogenase
MNDRRQFLKAAAALALMQPSRILGANDRVRIGICGLRGRGNDHIKGFSKVPGVEIAAVCDIDDSVTAQRVANIEQMGLPKPKTYVDIRKMLDDQTIDAISIATPNHWHSLMAIWGCQAKKDVYVEKPLSHNWWEGRQLVKAANKYDRIVQHGTQSRSSKGVHEAMAHMQAGLIGDVYMARGLCYKWRDTIGHTPVEPVPAGVDYDLWTGPAPKRAFTKNRFHYNWHWFWDTGNGDIGNQGIHEVDTARWGLGVKFPTKVSAVGGRFLFDDDQETPNVLNCSFEFDSPGQKKRMMEFEVRGWMTNHEGQIGTPGFGKSTIPPVASTAATASLGPATNKPVTVGNLFYGSKGYLVIDEYEAYKTFLGSAEEPGPNGRGKENHYENFIECVRSRRQADLSAPVEEGHISCTLFHLANVSYRLGRTLHFDPAAEQVIGDEAANRMLRDAERGYRAPFVVPENV